MLLVRLGNLLVQVEEIILLPVEKHHHLHLKQENKILSNLEYFEIA
jgi:hypothetical protein